MKKLFFKLLVVSASVGVLFTSIGCGGGSNGGYYKLDTIEIKSASGDKSIEKFTYNENGNINKFVLALNNKSFLTTFKYKNDLKDEIIYYKNGTIFDYLKFIYNAKKQVTHILERQDGSTSANLGDSKGNAYIYSYDINGNVIKEDIDYGNNGTIDETTNYYYTNNLLTSQENSEYKRYYTYNADGKLIELKEIKKSDNTIAQDNIYKYNSKGFVKEKNNKLNGDIETFLYSYDIYSNINSIKIYKNGSLKGTLLLTWKASSINCYNILKKMFDPKAYIETDPAKKDYILD